MPAVLDGRIILKTADDCLIMDRPSESALWLSGFLEYTASIDAREKGVKIVSGPTMVGKQATFIVEYL